jgi:hypothetical protein
MSRLIALALCFLNASVAFAQMYKCVDERGVTQYSDKPRPGCKGGPVDIRGQPPISGDAAPRGEDLKEQEREFQRRQIKRGEEEQKETQRAEAAQKRCENLRNQMQLYSRSQRVGTIDANGERHYMDDSEREARLAQLNAEIAQSCR